MNTKRLLIVIAVLAAVLIIGGVIFANKKSKSSPLGQLAQCLTDKGVKFFGAFWCPHCQRQKQWFGSAAKMLPYTECSTPDGKGQLQVCTDEKISGYPTWKFPIDITFSSTEAPTECIAPYEGQPAACKKASPGVRTWAVALMDNSYQLVESETEPVVDGDTYTFAKGTTLPGEVEPQTLGEITSCTSDAVAAEL